MLQIGTQKIYKILLCQEFIKIPSGNNSRQYI